MDGHTLRKSTPIGIIGPLYAFLYFTSDRRLLGFTLAGWLKFAPVAILAIAFLGRRPLIWMVTAIFLATLIQALYWKAKRDGFVSFIRQEVTSPSGPIDLPDDKKVSLRATGLFAVKDREDYVLLRPADYWRVPKGDHAIMVEQRPGRFLYQFIQPGSLQQIEPGTLYFGRQPKRSLAVRFLSSWGPDLDGEEIGHYTPSKNGSSTFLERKAYLTFDDEESMSTVWGNLLQDSDQPISEKI